VSRRGGSSIVNPNNDLKGSSRAANWCGIPGCRGSMHSCRDPLSRSPLDRRADGRQIAERRIKT